MGTSSRTALGSERARDDMPSALRSPLHPHSIDAAYTAVALNRRWFSREFQLRQPLSQRRERLLELGAREYLTEASMHTQAENEVTARMIVAPDVEGGPAQRTGPDPAWPTASTGSVCCRAELHIRRSRYLRQ